MRFDKVVSVVCFVFIFFLLLCYLHTRVYKYVLDGKLSRSSTIIHLSVDLGTQAKLICPVRYEDLKSLLWTKVDESKEKALIGNYSSLVISDNRFSVDVYELPTSELYYSWLTIANVREEDEGTYLCCNRWFNRTFIEVNLQVSEKLPADLKKN